jgi:hypothetical protein
MKETIFLFLYLFALFFQIGGKVTQKASYFALFSSEKTLFGTKSQPLPSVAFPIAFRLGIDGCLLVQRLMDVLRLSG